MPEEETCKRCGLKLTTEWFYVIVEGGADAGPYGRKCTEYVLAACAKQGLTATRRRAYA